MRNIHRQANTASIIADELYNIAPLIENKAISAGELSKIACDLAKRIEAQYDKQRRNKS